MFQPKYPDNPTPPPVHTHAPTDPAPVRRGLPSLS
ncbi:SpdD protein, partial [Streptomyces misionensis]